MPAPFLNVAEKATCNWTAMKPPDDRPETVVCVLSMLSAGRLTAAEAAPVARARTHAARRSNLNVIEVSRWCFWVRQPRPPCVRGFLKGTDQKEGRPPLWKRLALGADRHLHLGGLDFLHQVKVGH